jgi:hypothetical protein
MPDHPCDGLTPADDEIDAFALIAHPPFQATRRCNKLRRYTGIPVRRRP